MSLSLPRSCGPAILACVAAISPVRAQDNEAAPSAEATVSQQADVSESGATALGNPSPKAKDGSPREDLLTSLGVRISPEVLALAEIIRRMRRSVEQMPNYTCLQTIRRVRVGEKKRKRGKGKLRPDGFMEHKGALPLDSTDTVKIDVAFADGKELYSWPGARRFEDRPLPEIVGFGTVSTGDFAAHARTLFVNRNGQFSYVGEVDFKGRRAIRYDFRVPLFRSGYSITDAGGEATVGYGGSIWADADTKDLLRIEAKVEDVPPSLTMSQVINRLDYETVRIGGKEFQLPKRAHLATYFQTGAENHNWVEFSGCREFGAQSELSFTDTPKELVITTDLDPEEFALPPGVSLRLRLETAINSATSSTGDELRATVTRAVKHQGKVVIPRGAVAVGRLRRLESFSEPRDHFVVAFAFDRVEFGTKWVKLNAVLTDIAAFPGLSGEFGKSRSVSTNSRTLGLLFPTTQTVETENYSALALPGAAELYVRSKKFRIPAGHRMVWTTAER